MYPLIFTGKEAAQKFSLSVGRFRCGRFCRLSVPLLNPIFPDSFSGVHSALHLVIFLADHRALLICATNQPTRTFQKVVEGFEVLWTSDPVICCTFVQDSSPGACGITSQTSIQKVSEKQRVYVEVASGVFDWHPSLRISTICSEPKSTPKRPIFVHSCFAKLRKQSLLLHDNGEINPPRLHANLDPKVAPPPGFTFKAARDQAPLKTNSLVNSALDLFFWCSPGLDLRGCIVHCVQPPCV